MRPSRVDGLGAHLARDHEMGRVGTEWRKEEMGLTPAEERIMNGSMWADFCDKLKGAGELICTPESPDDVMNRALGHRLLLRLLRGGLEGSIDYADPQYPDFFRLVDETKHALNDNPDNYYLNAPISGKYEYRIRGRRGAAVRAVGGGVYRPRERIAGYRDLLKMLDWQRPGERWLLKSPAHLWALDVLGELFPDAMRRHVEANPQNRHGTHEYSLEEFGLTPGRSSALSACP